jgi:hypothetical protein
MRTILLVALAAAVCTAPASAGHSNGTGPMNDLVAGAGKFATTSVPVPGSETAIATAMAFSVSAHRTESGVHGNVNFRGVDSTGVELNGKGSVQCLEVSGNRAMVLFAFEDVRPFGDKFQQGLLLVEDNGEPSDAVPDRGIATSIANAEGAPLTACPTLADVASFATAPLESGNVIVHDGTE